MKYQLWWMDGNEWGRPYGTRLYTETERYEFMQDVAEYNSQLAADLHYGIVAWRAVVVVIRVGKR